MQVDIYNNKGEKTGRSLELPSEVFGIQPNDHCIYLAVKQYLASQRQGNHSTKTRAEVHGSSKKLHKQTGTGGSRKGNIRNPLYKGGGTINGPKPHDYDFKLNRKVKDLAKLSALTHKAIDNNVVVVEDFALTAPKTKDFAALINTLKGEKRRALVIIPDYDRNVYLSSRNVHNCQTDVLIDINTYDITHASVLIFTESAMKLIIDETQEAEVETAA
jgi:large subunit ribosomal protein L4